MQRPLPLRAVKVFFFSWSRTTFSSKMLAEAYVELMLFELAEISAALEISGEPERFTVLEMSGRADKFWLADEFVMQLAFWLADGAEELLLFTAPEISGSLVEEQ